jgi:UDP-N-acetylglucosamine 2-epimerase (non-hydrolysing)
MTRSQDPRSRGEPVRGRATLPPGVLPPGVTHDRRRPARRPVPVLLVIGSEADAIATVPLVLALREHPSLRPVVVSTGERPDLVDPVLQLAGIGPDVDLGCGSDVRRNELVASVMSRVDALCRERRAGGDGTAGPGHDADGSPGAVLVRGGTSAAAAAALSAFHLRLPVVHLDTGARADDAETFAGPTNRRLIADVACLHLAPTPRDAERLVKEGVPYDRVYVCGSTGVDAVRWAAALEQQPSDPAVAAVAASDGPLVVVSVSRREHWNGGIDRIASAVATLADRRPETSVVVPMHPDPVVRHQLIPHLGDRPNVVLTEPVPYAELAHLLARADLVLTDSGGTQEAAPALRTPVLVALEATECTEGVEAGTLQLVGTEPARILLWAERLLDDTPERRAMLQAVDPYGDGRTSVRIAEALGSLAGDTSAAPERFGPGFDRRAVLRAAGYRTLRHAAEEPAVDDDLAPVGI